MGKYTGRRRSPRHDAIAQLAFILYESRADRTATQIEGWLRAEQEVGRQLRVAPKDGRATVASVLRKVNL